MPLRQPQLPKRSTRFLVGKEIGGAVYVHRQYESLLPNAVQTAKAILPAAFNYTVVKFAVSHETVSFIQSEDFDESHEPIVGDLYTIKCDGSSSFRCKAADPWIYHHKWLFVADDYEGFDVEASRDRSRQWLALDNIDFRRIGKKSFWDSNVVPRLETDGEVDWIRSDDARKVLKMTACQLSHLRHAGAIRFRKSGNAFLYSAIDCRRIASAEMPAEGSGQQRQRPPTKQADLPVPSTTICDFPNATEES